MAQLVENPEQITVASGSTDTFATVWTFETVAEVQVWVAPVDGAFVLKTQGVHYDVSAGDWINAGANVVFRAGLGPTAGQKVLRRRVTPIKQDEPFGDTARFLPEASEAAYDRLTRMVQEVATRLDRAVTVNPGETPLSAEELAALVAGEAVLGANKTLSNLTDVAVARSNLGVPAYVQAKFSSREANVTDMADYDLTGVSDNTSSFRIIASQAAAAGVALQSPPGTSVLTSTIDMNDATYPMEGLILRGARGGPPNIWGANAAFNPRIATTFLFAHLGAGFLSTGRNNAGLSFSDFATRRQQPTPGAGWAPVAADYDFKFPLESDVKMENIHLHNATKGILANGDRFWFHKISGQVFVEGIRTTFNADTNRYEDIHFWPYWSVDPNVKAWQIANLEAFIMGRVDNPQMARIFAIWGKTALRLVPWAGDANYPAGSVSRLRWTSGDADSFQQLLKVDSGVVAPSTLLTGVLTQGPDTPSVLPQIDVQGTFGQFRFRDMAAQVAGGSIISVSGANNRVWADIESSAYDMLGTGVKAIVGSSTSKVTLSDGTRIAPITQTINGVTYTATTQPIADQGGAGVLVLGDGIRTRPVYVASTVGDFTSITGTMRYSIGPDGFVDFKLDITCTTRGTASGVLIFDLPYQASDQTRFSAASNTTGLLLNCGTTPGTFFASVTNLSNAFAINSAETINISGRYRPTILA